MARGLKNNNPLNIRHSSDNFEGEVPGKDKAFKSFKTMTYGYRAAFVILYTYLARDKRNTIDQIIRAWAPPEDGNNTAAYIAAVEKRSGISRNNVLTVNSGDNYIKIVAAMSNVENAKPAIISDVLAGFKLQSKLKQ